MNGISRHSLRQFRICVCGALSASESYRSIFLYLEIRVFEDILIIFYLILSGYLGTAVKGPHCS